MQGMLMRYLSTKYLIFFIFYTLITTSPVHGEIYRWVDDNGRVQFSDYPKPNYDSQAITSGQHSVGDKPNLKELEKTAQQLKKDRLKREVAADKLIQEQRKKRIKREKAIAKKKKREEACEAAREKEYLAFKNRSKSRNLTAMRKALERYEKKRKLRIKKCQ
jgi:hypothetical protein